MRVSRGRTVKISDLKHPRTNVRRHPEKQVDEFVRSLEKFGQIRPFVIDEENVVWCGNGMLEAMLRMGIDTAIADIYSGMTESDKKKLMLADNKISDLGIDDKFAMEELFGADDEEDRRTVTCPHCGGAFHV